MSHNRMKQFEAFATHPIQRKLVEKLKVAELAQCREFIVANDHLDVSAFAQKANMWMIGQARPKNYSTMWALVLQTNPVILSVKWGQE